MWIAYALLASLSFGTAAILQKLAAIGGKAHTSAWEVLVFQGLATVAVGLVGFFIVHEKFSRTEEVAYEWAMATGVALAVGAMFIFYAYTTAGAEHGDASRIQALVNTNTLVAVVLGLVVLKEWQNIHSVAEAARLAGGALLVVAGGIIISR